MKPWLPDHTGHSGECPVKVFQKVEVAAGVTITPKIKCGPLKVTCLEGKVLHDDHASSGHSKHASCKMVVLQELCVEVPIKFSAVANCELEEVHCGPAFTEDSGEESEGTGDSPGGSGEESEGTEDSPGGSGEESEGTEDSPGGSGEESEGKEDSSGSSEGESEGREDSSGSSEGESEGREDSSGSSEGESEGREDSSGSSGEE